MKNLVQRIKELPSIKIDLRLAKLPYGAVSFSSGFMLGMGLAYDVPLSATEVGIGLSSTSIIAATRAGIGTTRGNTLATLVNYYEPDQQLPKTEDEWQRYHSLENIGKRCAKVGLRYQVEALLGYVAGYVYGKMSQ